MLLMFASNRVMVSRIEANMMLKPMLPGLRLAARLKSIDGTFVKKIANCKLSSCGQ